MLSLSLVRGSIKFTDGRLPAFGGIDLIFVGIVVVATRRQNHFDP